VAFVTTSGCALCRALRPVLESVGSEYEGRVAVVGVDAANDPDDARALGAFAVPLLVALRDGREVSRRLGAAGAADVRAIFEAALGGAPVGHSRLSRSERSLRVLAGLGLAAVGLATGPRWLLVGLGTAVLALGAADLFRRPR
jgi:thioredoxin-like negative regulator of GroEL